MNDRQKAYEALIQSVVYSIIDWMAFVPVYLRYIGSCSHGSNGALLYGKSQIPVVVGKRGRCSQVLEKNIWKEFSKERKGVSSNYLASLQSGEYYWAHRSLNFIQVKKLTDDFSPKARDALELRTYIPKVMRPPWYCPIVVLQTGFVFQLWWGAIFIAIFW